MSHNAFFLIKYRFVKYDSPNNAFISRAGWLRKLSGMVLPICKPNDDLIHNITLRCGGTVSLDYLPTMLPQVARLLEAQADGEREETGS